MRLQYHLVLWVNAPNMNGAKPTARTVLLQISCPTPHYCRVCVCLLGPSHPPEFISIQRRREPHHPRIASPRYDHSLRHLCEVRPWHRSYQDGDTDDIDENTLKQLQEAVKWGDRRRGPKREDGEHHKSFFHAATHVVVAKLASGTGSRGDIFRDQAWAAPEVVGREKAKRGVDYVGCCVQPRFFNKFV